MKAHIPVPVPSIAMDGVRLGFWLSELARRLVELTQSLFQIDLDGAEMTCEKDGERLLGRMTDGEYRLPRIRALLLRYATLAVAKLHPTIDFSEYKPKDEWDRERGQGYKSISNALANTSAIKQAEIIQSLCAILLQTEAEAAKIGETHDCLEFAAALHEHLCGFQWERLQQRYAMMQKQANGT